MTSQPGAPDPILLRELDHYRERWKSTERLAEQRLNMLLTAVGTAIALSTAILALGTPKGGIHAHALLAGLWVVVAIVAEGVFIRLVRARRSICRDIRFINRLRVVLVDSADPKVTAVLKSVVDADSTEPRVFSVFSIHSASAVVAGSSVFAALWLANSGMTRTPPGDAFLFTFIVLALDLLWVWKTDARSRPPESSCQSKPSPA